MKKQETELLNAIRTSHPALYDEARKSALDRADSETSIFCYCGRLATGLHTVNCRRFREKLDRYTYEAAYWIAKKRGIDIENSRENE